MQNQTVITKLSDGELRRIYANASTLFERNSTVFSADKGDDPYEIERIWQHWKMSVGQGDETILMDRINYIDGASVDIKKLLGKVAANEELAPQAWWNLFEQILSAYEANKGKSDDSKTYSFLKSNDPFPFEELWLPIIELATVLLKDKSGTNLNHLSKDALIALQRALLRKLFILGSEVLLLEFNIYRKKRMSTLGLLMAENSEDIRNDIYSDFIVGHLQDGMGTIFMEYPVLGRLISTVTNNWIEATSEFVMRWDSDYLILEPLLIGEEQARNNSSNTLKSSSETKSLDLPSIAHIECSLSDSHNHGRTVYIIEYKSGKKIVYKPRSLYTENLWNKLLKWCNLKADLNLKVLEVIERKGYGWMEFAYYGKLTTQKEAQLYYHNCGSLLGLAYIMGSSDFHYENLIVNEGQPVIIDLETITHHGRRDGLITEGSLDKLLNEEFGESVIRTGMLPRWIAGEEGNSVDISAFGAVMSQSTRVKMPIWKNINTDIMKRIMEFKSSEPGKNAPMLGDEVVPPGPFRSDLLDGFTTVYKLFQSEKDTLLEKDSLILQLAGNHIRFIFRPTYRYYMLMHRCLDPACMRNGAARSVILDSLSSDLMGMENNPAFGILQQEHIALEREDCPYFSGSSNDLILNGGEGNVSNIITESAFDRILTRLDQLSNMDLEKQIAYISSSFDSSNHYNQHQEQQTAAEIKLQKPTVEYKITSDINTYLLDASKSIGDGLVRSIVRHKGKGSTWMTMRFLPEIKRHQLLGVGPNYFEGRVGVAHFLAALSKVSGLAVYADLALETMDGVRKDLKGEGAQQAIDGLGTHGLTGVAGIAYGMSNIGLLLNDSSLVDDALDLVNSLKTEESDNDHHLDFLSGMAGTISCLQRIHQISSSEQPLKKAVAYGQLLVSKQIDFKQRGKGWNTFEDKMITGFAHGQAGIAYALHALGTKVHNNEFIKAAADAVLLENSTFSIKENNWPDLRWKDLDDKELSYADGWCHGAPGIAMGRLGMMQLGTVDFQDDLTAAMRILEKANLDRVDHLCCGNAGRLMIYNELAIAVGDEKLQQKIAEKLMFIIERSKTSKNYSYWWKPSSYVTLPSLFQGSAGIGYSFLRKLAPSLVPNILLAE